MHDPLGEAERWLRQADVDLRAARSLTAGFPALACFHAQQSAEKALKAVLYAAGERPVLGHSIGELGGRVAAASEGYGELRAEATRLDRYYVPTRYPNGLPPGSDPAEAFTEDDAEGAIATADRVLRFAGAELDRRREIEDG